MSCASSSWITTSQISWLRDQFLDFSDAMNLDALIEPWRPQNPM
jgi:glycine cleavage system transcriptional repressor